MSLDRVAPGNPGIDARWTSSAKRGVGTAIGNQSRVWFTLSHGICNEIYYPCVDQACVRDMELIVTDGATLFSEEKRDTESDVHWLADGVPAFGLSNIPLKGHLSDYRLHVLIAPHLGNQGGGNTAWVGGVDEGRMLFAQRGGSALALLCSSPWMKLSVGYVGSSDGWQDLKAHKRMTWEYTRAENGNVALMGEVDLLKTKGEFVLALGFGKDPDKAARNAADSLLDGFEAAKHDYVEGWRRWSRTLTVPEKKEVTPGDLSQRSLAVLRTHESKLAPGALIASLAIPWEFSKGDEDQGGYHLVWSRDMVETAAGLLAAGAHDDARRVLGYLQKTQLPDGHRPQNMWLDGSPYWNGIQIDETALPILLVDLARREAALVEGDATQHWSVANRWEGTDFVVRFAAAVTNGQALRNTAQANGR